MKNALVLGGSRFIGYHLTQELLRQGVQVSHFRRNQTKPPRKFHKKIELFTGDRNTPEHWKKVFHKNYDVVFDLSGYEPAQIIPIVERYICRIGRYIFCSTASVMKIPAPNPYSENSPLVDVDDSYGGQKLKMEKLLLQASQKHDWPVTILRPQAVLGTFDEAQAGIIFSHLLQQTSISCSSKHMEAKLNLLDVNDLVKAFIAASNRNMCEAKIYAIASDHSVSLAEFIHLCEEISSHEAKIQHKDNAVFSCWHDYSLVANNSLIKKDLGITFTPLRETLTQIWNIYSKLEMKKRKWGFLWPLIRRLSAPD